MDKVFRDAVNQPIEGLAVQPGERVLDIGCGGGVTSAALAMAVGAHGKVTGLDVSKVTMTHPDLAGIHFTGSTPTFQHLWRTVGENITSYRSYPRIVGETGGRTSWWPTRRPTPTCCGSR